MSGINLNQYNLSHLFYSQYKMVQVSLFLKASQKVLNKIRYFSSATLLEIHGFQVTDVFKHGSSFIVSCNLSFFHYT